MGEPGRKRTLAIALSRALPAASLAAPLKSRIVVLTDTSPIVENPGPAMWVTATKDGLRDFLRNGLTPTFETCRSVKERMAEPTLAGFAFDGMPFFAAWSGSKARRQSEPIRWLFCDDSRGRVKVLWVQKRRDIHYLDCELKIDTTAVIAGHWKSARSIDAAAGARAQLKRRASHCRRIFSIALPFASSSISLSK